MISLGYGLALLGFWIFFSVACYVAHLQYMAGHDTWFFKHTTSEEKELQRAALDKAKMDSKIKI